MVQIDKALGALVIGTWTNYVLYTLELCQIYAYFRTYSHDHWALRGAVLSALIIDTVGTISNSVGVYNLSIRHFGDNSVFLTQGIEIPIYCITAGFSGLICQSYLIWRFFRLSKNRWVSAILLLMSLIATVFAVYTAHGVIVYNTYAERNLIVTPVIIWLSLEVASDVAVALALVLYLLKYTTNAFKQTQSLLYKLILISIESGSVSSLVAALVLVTYLTDLESNVTVGIGFNLGRIYTLTLLFNLNMRQSGLLATGSSGRETHPKDTVFTFAAGGRKAGTTRTAGDREDVITMVA